MVDPYSPSAYAEFLGDYGGPLTRSLSQRSTHRGGQNEDDLPAGRKRLILREKREKLRKKVDSTIPTSPQKGFQKHVRDRSDIEAGETMARASLSQPLIEEVRRRKKNSRTARKQQILKTRKRERKTQLDAQHLTSPAKDDSSFVRKRKDILAKEKRLNVSDRVLRSMRRKPPTPPSPMEVNSIESLSMDVDEQEVTATSSTRPLSPPTPMDVVQEDNLTERPKKRAAKRRRKY